MIVVKDVNPDSGENSFKIRFEFDWKRSPVLYNEPVYISWQIQINGFINTEAMRTLYRRNVPLTDRDWGYIRIWLKLHRAFASYPHLKEAIEELEQLALEHKPQLEVI